MEEVKRIIENIKKGLVSPLYFLTGEEPYFIDLISNYIRDHLISEEEKPFNQVVLYGMETSVGEIINQAKSYPLMAARRVIIIKEAQQLSKIEALESYIKNVTPTTVLVICYKHKLLDKRKSIYKTLQKQGFISHIKKLYENQIVLWMKSEVIKYGYSIDQSALQLLIEDIGMDIEVIKKALSKIFLIIPPKTTITSQIIEKHIGINREFNNFELRKAIGIKDYNKSMKIINYFIQNPKSSSIPQTIASLYSFFIQLLKMHAIVDKSKSNASKVLGVNPYFISDYYTASKVYSIKKITTVIGTIKEMDLMSKGITNKASYGDLLKELLVKIIL